MLKPSANFCPSSVYFVWHEEFVLGDHTCCKINGIKPLVGQIYVMMAYRIFTTIDFITKPVPDCIAE